MPSRIVWRSAGFFFEQRQSGHNLTWRAVAALQCIVSNKSGLQLM